MELIFSGLGGVLLIVLLTYVADTRKMRIDALIELSSYCDSVSVCFTKIYIEKKAIYTKTKRSLTQEEYNLITNELSLLIVISKSGALIDALYHEGDIMGMYNGLKSYFMIALKRLREADANTWEKEDPEILHIINNIIDPLQERFLTTLSENTKYSKIIFGDLRWALTTSVLLCLFLYIYYN